MKYYCVGIKGSGMGTLANILKDLGNEVSGYDDDTHYKYTEEVVTIKNLDNKKSLNVITKLSMNSWNFLPRTT